MSAQTRRRAAALFEVFGVYLTGAFLGDQVSHLLVRRGVMSPNNGLELLTVHTTNAELLIAARENLVTLILMYSAYLVLIIPISWWYRRRGRVAFGFTRAGHTWTALILAGFATACLTQWPVLVHTLVDAIHPLGAMAPWRQAFFDMSWKRWQFWLFAGVFSYAVIPVCEELIFRGYYQRRLAEDWGDGPAIIGTACFFTFAHSQYLIANAYNITLIVSLLCLAIGLGIVYAYTRSLVPSMIAHAIINVPATPFWQGVLLVVFIAGIFFAWRPARKATRQVFAKASVAACVALAALQTAYVIGAGRIEALTYAAIAMLLAALALEVIDRHQNPQSMHLANT